MNCIVAADANWNIGMNGKLLVSIPQDMQYFKQMTMGKVVIMGRKTLESFPKKKPLNGRINIVISGNPDYTVEGATVVHSIEEAVKAASKYDPKDVFCIGGGSIYRDMLPNLDEDPEWELVRRSEEETYFDLVYTFDMYRRKRPEEA